MTSHEMKQSLNNPATSYWLKNALIALERRDPVDVLCDISFLLEWATKRADEAGDDYLMAK